MSHKVYVVSEHLLEEREPDLILGVFEDRKNAEKCILKNQELDKKHYHAESKYYIDEKELES